MLVSSFQRIWMFSESKSIAVFECSLLRTSDIALDYEPMPYHQFEALVVLLSGMRTEVFSCVYITHLAFNSSTASPLFKKSFLTGVNSNFEMVIDSS